MRPTFLARAACALLLLAVGCGSHASKAPDTTVTPEPEAVPLPNVNPDAKPYPRNVGVTPRRGMQPGNAIPNLLFVGFPNSDRSSGLQSISLADFFDPAGKTYKLIHLSAAAMWCSDCILETDEAVKLARDLAAKGVVFVQALVEGPAGGTAATLGDLDKWTQTHQTRFTELLDPNLKNLGILFDGHEFPWNANIDARTMEILSAATGPSRDLSMEIQTWVDWVNAH